MKTNTRYLITATGVAAGLFAIGATANALTTDNASTPDPIGTGVVLPVAAEPSPSASPSVVEVEYAEPTEPSESPDVPAVLDTGGWATGSGSAVGDDDGHESDDHESDHHESESHEHEDDD
jgi:hypothetical protein